ncbi:uncharacterized protein BO87DRAFT_32175 [Aspergillus neoniger CBS 115656]|uniref:Uncharacterized protein n=1 Tax=Aspergillus neoniger (strain CBS 115656) TaxID=1448310 RepID=A0A318ZHP4_ASPNB|nr:hypothetical protein BO87DRAFT_32175 [Aspergillus neoniger CBS 115656]PYH35542.1 hypothetical protein BO87DRAFT_32175 [Aspergillus neoniger CBS 115656]
MHQVKRGRRNRLHPISSQKQINSEQQRQGKQTQSDTSQKDNLKQYPRSSILSLVFFFFLISHWVKADPHGDLELQQRRRTCTVCRSGWEGKSWVWVWNLTVIQPGVLDRIRPGERGWWVLSGRQTRECSRQV